MKQQPVKSKAISLIIITILGYFLNYLVNLLLTHHLDPALYGDFSIAIQVLLVVSTLILFGRHTTSRIFVSIYNDRQQTDKIKASIRWNTKRLIKPILLSSIIAILLILALLVMHYFNIHSLDDYHLALLFVFIAPIVSVGTLLVGYLSSHKQVFMSFIVWDVIRYFLALSLIGLTLLVIKPALASNDLLIIYSAAYLMLAFIAIRLYNRYSVAPISWDLIKHKYNTELHATWDKVSFRLGLCDISFNVLQYLDLFILEIVSTLLKHNAYNDQIGYYAAANLVAAFILLITTNIYVNIKQKVAYMPHHKENVAYLNKLIQHATLIGGAFTLVFLIAVISFPHEILQLYGADYTSATHVLIILAISCSMSQLGGASGAILIYAGLEKIYLRLISSTVVLMIILCVPLSYYYGMLGAAIASLLTWMFKNSMGIYYTRRYTKLKPLGFF